MKCVKFSIYFSKKISCRSPVMKIEMSTLLISFQKSQGRSLLHSSVVLFHFSGTKHLWLETLCVYFLLPKNKSSHQLQAMKFINQPKPPRNVTGIFKTTACFTAQVLCLRISMHLSNILTSFVCLNTDFLFKDADSCASNITFHILLVVSVPVEIEVG